MQSIKESFPYPILRYYSGEDTDYKSNIFDCKINYSHRDDSLLINYSVHLDCPTIKRLFNENKVSLGLSISSPDTFFRKDLALEKPEGEIVLDLDLLHGDVSISAFIIALEDIPDFFSEDWNDEYAGQNFSISSGNILAISRTCGFILNHKDSNFKSCLVFSLNENLGDFDYNFSFSNAKIKINLGPKIKFIKDKAMTHKLNQRFLYAILIKDCIVSALKKFIEDECETDKLWQKCIQKQLEDNNLYDRIRSDGMNMDFDELNCIAIKIVQDESFVQIYDKITSID